MQILIGGVVVYEIANWAAAAFLAGLVTLEALFLIGAAWFAQDPCDKPSCIYDV